MITASLGKLFSQTLLRPTAQFSSEGTAVGSVMISNGSGRVIWSFPDWQYISNKPATFPPSAHVHPYLPTAGGAMDNTNVVTNMNADLFDGINSDKFIYGGTVSGSFSAPLTWSAYDISQYKSGFWDINSAAWTPTNNWYWGITAAHSSNTPSYNYSGQQIYKIDGTESYFRTISGGTANTWRRIWHDGNLTDINQLPNGNLPTTRLVEPAYVASGVTATAKPLYDKLRADRLAFLPADQIIIEQSTDAGATWVDAGISDQYKTSLFTGALPSIGIPLKGGVRNTDCMLRITITGMKFNVPGGTAETNKFSYWTVANYLSSERYCRLDDAWFWVSAISDKIYTKVEYSLGSSPNSWTLEREGYFTGWSGGNYISLTSIAFGGYSGQTSNPWFRRFTFRTATSANDFDNAKLATTYTTSIQGVYHIKATGKEVWVTPNNLMYNDHLYSWDYQQNATFPAIVSATQLVSRVATGTPPVSVTSTTKVANLNSDYLDDQSGAYYNNSSTAWDNSTNTFSVVDGAGTKSAVITGFLESEVDGSTSNELNTSAAWNDVSNTFSVVDAGGTKSAVITGFLESEVDGSTSNELQTISKSTHDATKVDITLSNSGGTASVPTVTPSTGTNLAGLMSPADKTKLDGIAVNATANAGTVTSVGGTGSVNGITLSGSVSSSGNLTLGGALSNVSNSQLSNSTISGVALGSNLSSNTIKFDTGTTEGTDLYTYNGSSAKTIDVKAGTGISLTKAANSVTINATGPPMVYPGAGIPTSTGVAWGTSITNNSANWNTAFTNMGKVSVYGMAGYQTFDGYDWMTSSHGIAIARDAEPTQYSNSFVTSGTLYDYFLTKASLNGDLTKPFSVSQLNIEAGTYDFSIYGASGTLTIAQYGGNVSITNGIVGATGFSGSGASLTSINPANVSQTASYRFITDADKTNWDGKQSTISNGTGFLKNNGSGTWSYDNNSYALINGAYANYFQASEVRLGAANGWVVGVGTGFEIRYNGSVITKIGTDGIIESYDFKLSDARYKEHIKPIEDKTLKSIDDIKLVQYEFKKDSTNTLHYGVKAQEVKEVAPQLTKEGNDGRLSVNYEEFIIAKIAAMEHKYDTKIKDMQKEIDKLNHKVKRLEKAKKHYKVQINYDESDLTEPCNN